MLTFTKPPSNIYSRYVPSGYFVSMLNQAIQRVIFMHIFISYRFGSSDMFLFRPIDFVTTKIFLVCVKRCKYDGEYSMYRQ